MLNPKAAPKQPAGLNIIFVKDLLVVENILRNRDQFFAEISQGNGMQEKMRAMLVSSFAFMAVYGLLLGSTHSLGQTLGTAVKLPLLFLVTLIICAPVLYIFNILFGANQRLNQSVALVLAAITVTAVLLLSFAPITLFFILTVINHYQFFKLLNVFFFIIAGSMGAFFLSQGMEVVSALANPHVQEGKTNTHRLVFYLWIVVYIFVGSQMAWTLRPFVGYPNAPFELFRQVGGNFYTDILASIGEILGFVIIK